MTASPSLGATRLCRHGPEHSVGDCPYAHSLSLLRGPIESRERRPLAWAWHRVDRFYGQFMTDRQLVLFRLYWDHPSSSRDRPTWAICLYLLEEGVQDRWAFDLPWDFGLSLDLQMLLRDRNFDGAAPRPPFRFYTALWGRLHRRRTAMDRFYQVPDPEESLEPTESMAVPVVYNDAVPSPPSGESSDAESSGGDHPIGEWSEAVADAARA